MQGVDSLETLVWANHKAGTITCEPTRANMASPFLANQEAIFRARLTISTRVGKSCASVFFCCFFVVFFFLLSR